MGVNPVQVQVLSRPPCTSRFASVHGGPSCYNFVVVCGGSSVGRTSPCQGEGRRFESGPPLQGRFVIVIAKGKF